MSDSFTEVTHESWFSRLMDSFKSVLAGGAMFLLAFPVLFLNEGCSARTIALIATGREHVVDASADSVDTTQNGALIHVSGRAETDEVLTDSELGLAVNAIRFNREVEIYQWVEHKETRESKKYGGGTERETTWSYEREWVDRPVDSSRFHSGSAKYHNEGEMEFENQVWTASDVRLGVRQLSEELVSQIGGRQFLPVGPEDLKELPANLREELQVDSEQFYYGNDPARPEIGDLRISYHVVLPQEVTVLAAQSGDTFQPWAPPRGSGTISRLEPGLHTAPAMFDLWSSSNSSRTWMVRLGGYLMMTAGLAMVFRPLVVVADVLPFLGTLLGWGVGLFSSVVAASFSLTTIAIAWIFYRPLLGLGLLVVAAVAVFLLYRVGRKGPHSRHTGTTPEPDPA